MKRSLDCGLHKLLHSLHCFNAGSFCSPRWLRTQRGTGGLLPAQDSSEDCWGQSLFYLPTDYKTWFCGDDEATLTRKNDWLQARRKRDLNSWCVRETDYRVLGKSSFYYHTRLRIFRHPQRDRRQISWSINDEREAAVGSRNDIQVEKLLQLSNCFSSFSGSADTFVGSSSDPMEVKPAMETLSAIWDK